MIAIIRIKGIVGVREDMEATLDRLRLRKKYVCVVVQKTPDVLGRIKKVKDYIAYGEIDKETLKELVKKRGKAIGNAKIDAEKIASELMEGKTGKNISEFGVKPFFRLHPPRGGIESKRHFPKGVLGNHKEKINELIKRML